MPDTTLTINHADGGSETYTINRDKFEGIRDMTVKTFGESTSVVYPASPQDVTGFTVTNADLMSGTYVSDGLYQGKPSFRHTTFSGYKIRWEVVEWEFHDGSSEDQVQFTGSQDTDYPWDVTSWNIQNANSGSPVFSNPVGGYFEETTVVVDGTTTETYTVDHTPPEDIRNLLVDAQNITINRDKGEEFRTLFIDGVEVTIDRTGEVVVKRLLDLFTGASSAYSLQQLGDYQALINARRGSDNVEVDVYPDNTNNREVSADSPITVTSGSSTATTFGEFLTEESSTTKDAEDGSTSGFSTSDFVSSSAISTTSSNPISGTKSYLMSHTGTSGAVGYPRLDVPRSSGFVFALNKEYRVQFKIKLISGTTSIFGIRFGQSGSGANASPASVNLTLGQVIEYDGIINATSIGGNQILNLQFDGTDGDFEVLIDDIKITANEYDCTVTTWYDQAGSNDASQPLDDAQPKIAENGVVLADGIDFDGVDDGLVSSNDYTTTGWGFAVYNPAGNVESLVANSKNLALNVGSQMRVGSSGNNEDFNIPNLNRQVGSFNFNSTAECFINGVASSKATDETSPANSSKISIGYRDGDLTPSMFWSSTISEIILYPSDQSANRTAIEANINGRYSIY